MFKVAKESYSSLIRNSLKLLVFSSLTRKFQVCVVRPIYIGMLSKGNIWLQRRTFYRTMSILYVFFRALLLWWKRTKQKEGEREMIRRAVRKMKKKLATAIMAFLYGLCLIGLNMGFGQSQNISGEFLPAEFDLISCKAMR